MEGFRSLAVIATFFAGLQAQMLSASLMNNTDTADKIVNAFWLAGISLDIFGAVQASIAARWFELLNVEEVETLNKEWTVPQMARQQSCSYCNYRILKHAPTDSKHWQATFFAGLQAQMLSASLMNNTDTADKIVNAFWLAGISLDIFGAVQACIAARWFELLNVEEVETLNKEWTVPQMARQQSCSYSMDVFIAASLFSGLPIVACGVLLFLVGLVIYIWTRQPIVVSIISTIPVAILSPLVLVCFYPHSGRKDSIIKLLAGKRGAW